MLNIVNFEHISHAVLVFLQIISQKTSPAGIYKLKVNTRNKVLIIVNFKHISHVVRCFYSSFWTYNCRLGPQAKNTLQENKSQKLSVLVVVSLNLILKK